MDRHAAVALAAALLCAGPSAGKPQRVAPSLHVRAIDLVKREVLIEVAGLPHAPPGNQFTFTDERGRHYIALDARCDQPFPSGTRACELEIPDGYQRHKLVSLELHLHGLHGRTVGAERAEIDGAWAAAVANAGEPHLPLDGGAPSDAAP